MFKINESSINDLYVSLARKVFTVPMNLNNIFLEKNALYSASKLIKFEPKINIHTTNKKQFF